MPYIPWQRGANAKETTRYFFSLTHIQNARFSYAGLAGTVFIRPRWTYYNSYLFVAVATTAIRGCSTAAVRLLLSSCRPISKRTGSMKAPEQHLRPPVIMLKAVRSSRRLVLSKIPDYQV